uniref:Uncharacterized protein n=1 Tax=Accipiter nisus TaxID=211598 RepID=A0A8B9S1J4_9AVES
MVAPATLRVVRCGGSTLHGARPVFSADSKYLLCAAGDFVKMYSVATEETLRLMGGHADLVTGVQLNPHNHILPGGSLPTSSLPSLFAAAPALALSLPGFFWCPYINKNYLSRWTVSAYCLCKI